MWWGIVLSVMGLSGYTLINVGWVRTGNWVTLIDQVLWVIFAEHVNQPGLWLGCIGYTFVSISALTQAKRCRNVRVVGKHKRLKDGATICVS